MIISMLGHFMQGVIGLFEPKVFICELNLKDIILKNVQAK